MERFFRQPHPGLLLLEAYLPGDVTVESALPPFLAIEREVTEVLFSSLNQQLGRILSDTGQIILHAQTGTSRKTTFGGWASAAGSGARINAQMGR